MKKVLLVTLTLLMLCGDAFAESLDITNFDFGIGMSQQSGDVKANLCLESHYFFETNIFNKDAGVGPFVFLTTSKPTEEKPQSLGVGIMLGLQAHDREYLSPGVLVKSFNLGFGVIKNKLNVVFSTSF